MKTKRCGRTLCLLLLMMTLLTLCGGIASANGADASAGVRYTNPQTGYRVMILDDDDLLSDTEEDALLQTMVPITDYGHIIFWSTEEYTYDELEQAKNKRYTLCGSESSGILVINMNVRMVTFQSDGAIYSLVSSSYARSITDNVSGYASSGDYYTCAATAFVQVGQVLQGNRIAEPMKYISYIVIGLMLSFVIVVGTVFGKRFNPLVKENDDKACMIGRGYLSVDKPTVKCIDTSPRGWVTVLLVILRILASSIGSGGGGSSRSGGGGSSGGGGGGSSRF